MAEAKFSPRIANDGDCGVSVHGTSELDESEHAIRVCFSSSAWCVAPSSSSVRIDDRIPAQFRVTISTLPKEWQGNLLSPRQCCSGQLSVLSQHMPPTHYSLILHMSRLSQGTAKSPSKCCSLSGPLCTSVNHWSCRRSLSSYCIEMHRD